MAQWKIGDVVQLKSGGPTMTVAKVNVGLSGEDVWCLWFEGKKRNEGAFHPDALHVPKAGPGIVVG